MTDHQTAAVRYSTVAMWFHWTIAALIVANMIIGFFHDAIGMMQPHRSIGLTVLALTLARVAWRLTHRPPPLPAHTPGWERGLAHAAHWALYGLMIALPITGWMMVSGSRSRPLNWFFVFDIPYLPIDKATAGIGAEAHEILAWVMLALFVLHVGAALRHRWILRDGIMGRMAPALER